MENRYIPYDLDLPRIVLLEKIHPFVISILRSLECKYFETDLYYYGKDFVVYQESKIAGEKVYCKDIVFVRAMYFNMNELLKLETSATFPGIISRTDWNWLTTCLGKRYYVYPVRRYLLTTNLLFIHKDGKIELIKSLIKEKKHCDKFSLDSELKDYYSKVRVISDDLPVRICFTKFSGKDLATDVLTNDEYDKVYIHDDFKKNIDCWLNGEKNIMLKWEINLTLK